MCASSCCTSSPRYPHLTMLVLRQSLRFTSSRLSYMSSFAKCETPLKISGISNVITRLWAWRVLSECRHVTLAGCQAGGVIGVEELRQQPALLHPPHSRETHTQTHKLGEWDYSTHSDFRLFTPSGHCASISLCMSDYNRHLHFLPLR